MASNLPYSNEDVELMLFDAQCQRLRVFHPAFILRDQKDNFKKYKIYEAFEKKARNDKDLIKKIANGDFYDIAENRNNSCTKKNEIQEIKKNYIIKKRKNFTYNDEVKNIEAAFKKGIVRIPIKHAVNYDEAKLIAEEKAYRLPTRWELINSGANEGNCVNFFTFVLNDDGKDMVQMGNGPN